MTQTPCPTGYFYWIVQRMVQSLNNLKTFIQSYIK